MKVYEILNILSADDIYIVNSEGKTLLHAEGLHAINAVADLYERRTIAKLIPTKNAIEMHLE